MKRPVRRSSARSSASIMRTVDVLPFVPATCTARVGQLRIAQGVHERRHALELPFDARLGPAIE